MVVLDEQKGKAIQYQSDPTFNFDFAQKSLNGILKGEFPHNVQVFGNNDYDYIESDLRGYRANAKTQR